MYSVIVPAYKNPAAIERSLSRIVEIADESAEIIVWINGNNYELFNCLGRFAGRVSIHICVDNLGPGGARNKMLRLAKFRYVFSFDDDSYPVESDFFKQALIYFNKYESVTVFVFNVYHRGESEPSNRIESVLTKDFIGCACAYDKFSLPANVSYVPIPCAYGMEEVDYALQLTELNCKIMHLGFLTVFHDTELSKHATTFNNHHSILNIFLLCFLRFPIWLWWLGLYKVFSRVRWMIQNGRYSGILSAFFLFPPYCLKFRSYRKTLSTSVIIRYFLS